MQDYTRGDVEFLAMEMFHEDNGQNRSWFSWNGNPSKEEYRKRAKSELDLPLEPIIEFKDNTLVMKDNGFEGVLATNNKKPKQSRARSAKDLKRT